MGANRHPRRAAHLEMSGGKSSRQRLWETIRNCRREFSMASIAWDAGEIDRDTARTYIQALVIAGYIEHTNPDRGPQEEKRFRLLRDAGLEAPRLTRHGQPVTQGLAQEQMWRTMRILGREFSPDELAAMATTGAAVVTPTAALHYLKHLVRAGYAERFRRKGQRDGSYRFISARYTGPRPPMIQRTKSVYDPNLGRIVWQEEPSDDI